MTTGKKLFRNKNLLHKTWKITIASRNNYNLKHQQPINLFIFFFLDYLVFLYALIDFETVTMGLNVI